MLPFPGVSSQLLKAYSPSPSCWQRNRTTGGGTRCDWPRHHVRGRQAQAPFAGQDYDQDEDDEDIDWDDRLHFPVGEKEIDIPKNHRDIIHLEITLDAFYSSTCKGLCLVCGTDLNRSPQRCMCWSQCRWDDDDDANRTLHNLWQNQFPYRIVWQDRTIGGGAAKGTVATAQGTKTSNVQSYISFSLFILWNYRRSHFHRIDGASLFDCSSEASWLWFVVALILLSESRSLQFLDVMLLQNL